MSDEGFASLESGPWTVVLEDNGRVGYAYLLKDGQICADVWLYNAMPANANPEWERPDAEELMPFANASEYVHDGPHPSIGPDLPWSVNWDGLAGTDGVLVTIAGELWAQLVPGEARGRSRLVRSDGPLGKVLRPQL